MTAITVASVLNGRFGLVYIVIPILVVLAAVSFYLAYLDLVFFGVQRNVKSWSERYPPSSAELDAAKSQLSTILKPYNPNSIWLNAIVLEWQAYNDPDNARFYLIQAESSLRQALKMRPSDGRLWAHLAVLKEKQQKSPEDIKEAADKARRFGPYDPDTIKILKRLNQPSP